MKAFSSTFFPYYGSSPIRFSSSRFPLGKNLFVPFSSFLGAAPTKEHPLLLPGFWTNSNFSSMRNSQNVLPSVSVPLNPHQCLLSLNLSSVYNLHHMLELLIMYYFVLFSNVYVALIYNILLKTPYIQESQHIFFCVCHNSRYILFTFITLSPFLQYSFT